LLLLCDYIKPFSKLQ